MYLLETRYCNCNIIVLMVASVICVGNVWDRGGSRTRLFVLSRGKGSAVLPDSVWETDRGCTERERERRVCRRYRLRDFRCSHCNTCIYIHIYISHIHIRTSYIHSRCILRNIYNYVFRKNTYNFHRIVSTKTEQFIESRQLFVTR